MIMPWDLDMWMELNNGRTLTIYDLGRIPLAQRAGLVTALRKNRWGLTMAGASVMYRKRVRMFDRVTVKSRALGWDDKFIYLEQSMWKGEACTSHILYRSAVTDRNGIVPPPRGAGGHGLAAASRLGHRLDRGGPAPAMAARHVTQILRPPLH